MGTQRPVKKKNSTGGILWLHSPPTATNIILEKIGVPDTIGEPTKYSKHKNENGLVFSGLYLGMVKSIRAEKHILTKYGRAIFIDIDAYQQGQDS